MRVLISTFGSGGDLFPLVPVAEELRSRGHDVLLALPRSLGLYARALQLRTVAIGDGREMRVLEDPLIFTTRFSGWDSWRRTLVTYVAPSLVDDVRGIARVCERWKPDVIVTSGFAVAARAAAELTTSPLVELSIYPQHEYASGRGLRLAGACAATLVRELGEGVARHRIRELMWGVPADALIVDPAIYGAEHRSDAMVGFPYWDEVPHEPNDLGRALMHLRGGPTVVVTLGSFIGLRASEVAIRVARGARRLGLRCLMVGQRRHERIEELCERDGAVESVGFLPLSRLLGEAHALVHHGGIGTTHAAIRAQCPSIIVPQAFDQSFNAERVQRGSFGVVGSLDQLESSIEAAASDRTIRTSLARVQSALVPPHLATIRAVATVESALA